MNCFNESFPGIFQLGKVVSKLNVKNVPKLHVKNVKISSFQNPRLGRYTGTFESYGPHVFHHPEKAKTKKETKEENAERQEA